ncbi:MAG: hypothetical protein R6U55_11975, partial [Desulfovermiculus sp.]
MFEAINDYSYLAGNIGLEETINALDSELPGFDAFLTGWIKLLEDQRNIKVSRLLREAVVLKGGVTAISVLARQHADKYPLAYLDWIKALREEGEADSIIDVAREGLVAIPKDYRVRAEIAEVISRMGEELNDDDLKLEGYRESFHSNPSINYLLDLYVTAIECDCFKAVRDQAEQRLWELFKQDREPVCSYYHAELSRAYLSEGVLYRSLVLGGRYAELFELCKGKGSLGWSGGNNPKPFFIILIMVLLSNEGKHSNIIHKQWNNLLAGSVYEIDNIQANKYKKIIAVTSRYIQLTEEQEALYLK